MRTTRRERMSELMKLDGELFRAGISFAGMDEAGRGPLMGDVVVGCVVMPYEPQIEWVDDSKKLSEKRREMVFEEIMKTALFVGVGSASPAEIDEMNILCATKLAMRRAAKGAPATLCLVDSVKNIGLEIEERAFDHGDAISYSIAAASIVAKVTRDRQMAELDRLYPGYGFLKNKGYGTPEHIAALKALGPCPIHRRSFIGHFVTI
ncbi:MAG: ribonuclease HII [Eubacteriales bacterium]|nr:ribonuclease HII [Eubacteriales bacterium]MDD3880750.1 ribonuclease HII [Eubacteriales bacterium]MDD3882903.1 ribonuclease HII [Eubacteriales bacterium]MDD4511617.1 ribonuclease HII [Eubacteriales bacterium]